MVRILVYFVLSPARYEVELGPVFFCLSLSLHFSKRKKSIYLCVFVIESLFLIAWMGLDWICLLAGIVTLTFGVQSIDYFHNTNSELACYFHRYSKLIRRIFVTAW